MTDAREPLGWMLAGAVEYIRKGQRQGRSSITVVHPSPNEEMDWTTPVYLYPAPVTELEAENERLRKALHDAADALAEALEDVEHWASYAGEYFQNKHNLMGDLDRIREHINIARSGGKLDD